MEEEVVKKRVGRPARSTGKKPKKNEPVPVKEVVEMEKVALDSIKFDDYGPKELKDLKTRLDTYITSRKNVILANMKKEGEDWGLTPEEILKVEYPPIYAENGTSNKWDGRGYAIPAWLRDAYKADPNSIIDPTTNEPKPLSTKHKKLVDKAITKREESQKKKST